MLRPFSNVLKYIWNPDEVNGVADNAATSVASQFSETKEITGKVTSIHSGYGMIDGEIYFALDCTKNQHVPQVNNIVKVKATRQQDSGGWRAVSLRILDQEDEIGWEDKNQDVTLSTKQSSNNPGDVKSEQFTVGMVTRTGKDGGVVNESYNFLFSDCSHEYVPHKGDWVNVKLSSDSTGTVSIKPLREQSFEGKVNTVQSGFGYINGDIYFTFSVCEEGFVPRRGERVCGKAVESSRGRSTWRALSVVPIQGPLADKFISPEVLRSPMQLKSLKDLYADKEGISVTDPIDFGKLQLGSLKPFTIWIRNSGKSPQKLESLEVKSTTDSQFHLTSDVSCHCIDTRLELPPAESTKILLYCTAKYLGNENQLLVVNFTSFQVGRQVAVSVTDPQQYNLTSVRPYEKRAGYSRYRASQEGTTEGWVVPGQRPQSCQPNIQLPNRLPQFPIPCELRRCFLDREDLVYLVPALGEELTMENYTRRFKTLLHLEEIQQEIDIRDFDLERVCLRPCGEYLSLTVPGLAEGRPSVLIGDRVILSDPVMPENSPEYEGYIHEVKRDEVLLKCEQNFHSGYHGEDYNVRFTFNRTTLRRCHQATEFAPTLGAHVLFSEHLLPKPPQNKSTRAITNEPVSPVIKQSPASIGMKKGPRGRRQQSETETIKLYNTKLNVRQKAAVTRILRGQSRPTPYILFGPPGTGKTVTVVESILQIFTVVSGSRIIACAPSNSAADLLCERLHESGCVVEGDMVRLNAFQRTEESIPESIRRYVCTGTSLELVSRYRILVCTCVSAGMMFSLGLKSGHFTHAFVDEAGQATEAECMIPIGLVAGTDGQVVLAGDPMQLGPVLQCREAKDYGLGMSLLERLIHRELYSRNENKFYDHGSYDPLLVTKLVENYRSHPALIHLPSKLFYHDELVVSAEKELIDCLCDWEELPNKSGCPFIFHGMRGEDLREGNSPSWFNPVEAVQVMKYLQAVVSNSVHTLSFDDIGIITPYRKQVEKIRLLIDKLGMEKVKVGSVEEFQGQERLVMIISTVRSNESHVGVDLRHNLGFLSNEKRFNVAITRAQALLIVIGNPHVLYQDPMWKSLIKYAVRQNAYIGCDLPELGEVTDTESEGEEEEMAQAQSENSSSYEVAVEPVAPPSKLEKKLIRQMEYYFGDMNLIKDAFLQDQIQHSQQGWVDLAVIMTFNRMKILTTEIDVVCAALEKSSSGLIEMNEERTHVRRSVLRPLVTDFELWKDQLRWRTIVVEGLKVADTASMENFQNLLEVDFGEVEHIERGIPKVKKGKSHHAGFAQLVVFKEASSVGNLPPSGQLILLGQQCWVLEPPHIAVNECIDYFYKRHVKKLDRYLVKPVGRHWYSTNNHHTKENRDQPKPLQSPSESHFRNAVVEEFIKPKPLQSPSETHFRNAVVEDFIKGHQAGESSSASQVVHSSPDTEQQGARTGRERFTGNKLQQDSDSDSDTRGLLGRTNTEVTSESSGSGTRQKGSFYQVESSVSGPKKKGSSYQAESSVSGTKEKGSSYQEESSISGPNEKCSFVKEMTQCRLSDGQQNVTDVSSTGESIGTEGSRRSRELDVERHMDLIDEPAESSMDSQTRIQRYLKYMEKDGIKYVRGKRAAQTPQQLGEQDEEEWHINDPGVSCSSSNTSTTPPKYLEPSPENHGGLRLLSESNRKGDNGGYCEEDNVKRPESQSTNTAAESIGRGYVGVDDTQSGSCVGRSGGQRIVGNLAMPSVLSSVHGKTVDPSIVDQKTKKTDDTAEVEVCLTDGVFTEAKDVSANAESVPSGRCIREIRTSPRCRNRANLPGIGRGVKVNTKENGRDDVQTTRLKAGKVGSDKDEAWRYADLNIDPDEVHNKEEDLLEVKGGDLTDFGLPETSDQIDNVVKCYEQVSSKDSLNMVVGAFGSHGKLSDTSQLSLATSTSPYCSPQRTVDEDLYVDVIGDENDLLTRTEILFHQSSEPDYRASMASSPCKVNIIDINSDEAFNQYQTLPTYYCPELVQSDSDVIIEEEEEEEVEDHMTGGHVTGHVTERRDGKLPIFDPPNALSNGNNSENPDENWT